MLATGPRYYAKQQHLTALAVRQLRRASSVDRALPLLATYQANAALLALQYGTDALQEQRISGNGAEVIPEAFTVTPGVPSVLDDADTQFKFDRIVSSLVADAGRSAMGAFTTSRYERRIGNIRQLTAPSCSRCAILAGRFYRWSEGFKRHPRCDCVMVPGSPSIASYDPNAAFERGEIGSYRTLPDGTKRFQQGLSKVQREAINDGADIGQVVNAQRGMQTVNFAGRRVQVTTGGTTSRGFAFDRLAERGGSARVDAGFATRITRNGPETRRVTKTVARAPRLSPEAIYNVADGSRDTAIRLLRANGYIV